MELRELSYFVAVYEEKTLTAAARRSFVSQPSVSAALASLEHELDTALFVRHRRGVTPTAAAEELYPRARRLVDEAKAVRASFRDKVPPREVTIGIMAAICADRVREVLSLVGAEPGARLRVVGAGEKSDLRLVARSMLEKGESFVRLWKEPFVVAIPSSHPLALVARVRVADLATAPLVERCHCEHTRHLARGKKRPRTVASATSEEWALALVAAGVGLAIVPRGSVRTEPRVVVRPIEDVAVEREVGLAFRRTTSGARALEGLVERVRAAIAA